MIIIDNKNRSLDLRFEANSTYIDGSPRMVYILKGPPTPLARARAKTQFYGGRQKLTFYNSQYEKMNFASIDLENQHNLRPEYSGPLHLDVTFHFKRIRSPLAKTKIAQYRYFHNSKPDLSNLIKYIEDICNKILYKDDALISSIIAKKVYDDHQDYTEFFLIELDKANKAEKK